VNPNLQRSRIPRTERQRSEEEGELFSLARDVLTDEQAEELGERMAAEKQAMATAIKKKIAAAG
jgi:hypothetical protein